MPINDISQNTILIIALAVFLFLAVLLLFFFLIQKKIQESMSNTFQSLSTQIQSDKDKLNQFVFEMQKKSQQENFETQTELKNSIFQNFLGFSDTLSTHLKSGTASSQETFSKVMERLARIDEAQKSLDSLSDNVMNLSHVLNDKKTRGIFGEAQLSQILYQIFGESHTCYSLQHKMPNSTIVDCLLYLPEPMGKLAIDSKFPLENFRRLQQAREEGIETKKIETSFKKDLKKHIDDIAKKYIIDGFTSHQAMMFIPAETIYLEVQSHFLDIVDYAHQKRVWIASPTTMMSILSTVQVVIKGQKQSQNIELIQNELKSLSKDFKLWRDRWDKLSRNLETTHKSIQEINISSDKMSKKFQKVINCDIGESRDLIKENNQSLEN